MYRKKNRELHKESVTVSLEELVPEKIIYLIYDEVKNLYSDKGRPKICSMRQTIKKIEVKIMFADLPTFR